MENGENKKAFFGEHESEARQAGEDLSRTRVASGSNEGGKAGNKPLPNDGKTITYGNGGNKKPGGEPSPGVKDILKKYNVIIGIAAGLALLLLVSAIVLPMILAGGGDDSSTSVSDDSEQGDSSGSSSGSDINDDYNPDENVIDVDKYPDTILAKSEKAGDDYIDDTLFIGDSNTVRMLAYRDVTKVSMQNCIGYEGMGITSFTSLEFVKFKFSDGSQKVVTIPKAIELLQPRRVLINLGTNNAGGMSVKSFIESYEKAIDAVRDSYEYADIIIASVFPVDRYNSYGTSVSMKKIDEFNAALVELAEKKDCKFLNWSEAMKDSKTGFCKTDYTIQDGIHISKAGATEIFDYFINHSFITEDGRPKPLKPIPERTGNVPGLIIKDPDKNTAAPSPTPEVGIELLIAAYNDSDGKMGGGKIKFQEASKTSFTIDVQPLDVLSQVVAVPDEGYEFSHWSCTHGRIEDNKDPILPGYTMPGHVEVGTSADLIAHFVKQGKVPKVVGLNVDSGTAVAEGWVVEVSSRKFDASAKGTVLEQSPKEGSAVEKGKEKIIYVVVSSGAGAAIPDFSAGSTDGAGYIGSLQSLGFTNVVRETMETEDAGLDGKVAQVSHTAGTMVSLNQKITVTVYQKKAAPPPTDPPPTEPPPTDPPPTEPPPETTDPPVDPPVEPGPSGDQTSDSGNSQSGDAPGA